MSSSVEITRQGAKTVARFRDFSYSFSSVRFNTQKVAAYVEIEYIPTRKKLFAARIDLLDLKQRHFLSEHLKILNANINWKQDLTLVFTAVLNELTKYEPPVRIDQVEPRKNRYFIYPLIADPITLIFAVGGSGKSIFSLYFASLVQAGLNDFFDIQEPMNVLYLDWEASREEFASRYFALSEGTIGLQAPLYKNMRRPLEQVFDEILNDIIEYDVKLLIIDSVVPALGGNINDAEIVGDFFTMLREYYHQNGTRILLLTHISKSEKKEENSRSPIGSVYFENYPRLVWEMKSINLTNKLSLEFYPYKANVSYPKPFGVDFYFDGEVIATSIKELEIDDTLENAVMQIINNQNEIRLKELKDTLKKEFDITQEELRRILKKLIGAKKVVQTRYGYYASVENIKSGDIPPF